MKKMNFWLLASLFVGALTLTSCGDDDDNVSGGNNGGGGSSSGTENVDYSQTGGTVVVKQLDVVELVNVTVPKYSSTDLSGIELVDDELSLSYYVSEEVDSVYTYCGFNLTISGYSESKTSYGKDDVYLGFSQGAGNKYYQGNSVYYRNGQPAPSNITATVNKQKNGTYRIVVDGEIYLNGSDITLSDENPNATIKLDVVAPLVATMKLHKNVSSVQSYFPAGTPWPAGQTAAGALEISSPLVGSGVLLWYYDKYHEDGSHDFLYAQYEDLKAQAVKTMGEPFECMDASMVPDSLKAGMGEYSDIAYAYFYKDKKYVMVSYCPWRNTYAEDDEPNLPNRLGAIGENHAARLHVHILEGMNVDYKQFVHSFR